VKSKISWRQTTSAVLFFLHSSKNGKSIGEFYTKLNPTNSCFEINPNGRIHLRTKLEEDYKGDKKAQIEAISNGDSLLITLIENQKFLQTQMKELREHLTVLAKMEGIESNMSEPIRFSDQVSNN
jgi:hypothetical protein